MDIDYKKLLPENPPKDLVKWMIKKGAFDNTDYILFKQGYKENPQTGKKEIAASCICTACGNTFFEDWIEKECRHGGYGIEHENKQIYKGPIKCPHCKKKHDIWHVSKVSQHTGRRTERYVTVPSKAGKHLVLTEYMVIKEINPKGETHFFVNEFEAYIFLPKKTLYFKHYQKNIYDICWLNEWRQLKKIYDEMGTPKYIYKKIKTAGTYMENAKLYEYKKQAETFLSVSYLRLYQKHENVENLITAGLGWLVGNEIQRECNPAYYGVKVKLARLDFVKWKEKSPYKMLEIDRNEEKAIKQKYGEEISGSQLIALKQLREIFGKKIDKTIVEIETCMSSYDINKIYEELPQKEAAKAIVYLIKQKCDYLFYKDYLEMAKKNGEDVNDEKKKYPKSLVIEHNKEVKKLKFIESQKFIKGFKQLAEAYECLSFEKGEYSIRIAKNEKELIDEGRRLKHCVGNYGGRHVKGDSIFFVRKQKDLPLYTLQVDIKTGRQLQLHGYDNELSGQVIDPNAIDFINFWLENVFLKYNFENNKLIPKSRKNSAA